ncbi:SRPBCC family protein [Nocardioides jiangxiensis]|uniref:SRPBCC family protein n=1 Tax=Nocardioides jiangxiensis TaxID=3064524 RepID=A0ABT9B0Q3_9ACTN|nr:SRPBCC family protein [Nocardioides sp. WY-20]MDO7866851.1 SRPBCC family protein [Nocardioides sp. WY-20]
MRATSTATVRVNIDEAWRILSDHAGMTDWGPGVTAVVTKPGTPEPNGVGAVRKITAPGPAPAIVEEITTFEAPTRLGYKALAGVPFADYAGEVSLVATESGTEITWTLSARQRVPFVEQKALKALSLGLLQAYVRRLKRAA